MKNIVSRILLVFITAGVISCVKKNEGMLRPLKVAKSDTSTTLITNTELVGNWNIVTDSISWSIDSVYRGTPGDHYNFTKYGNLYIRSAFENYTDTATYTISSSNILNWVNSYFSDIGGTITERSQVGPFTIATLTPNSLVITQKELTTLGGIRYEMITFKK